jgi:hybrid cluster-associated redox disulfide protein
MTFFSFVNYNYFLIFPLVFSKAQGYNSARNVWEGHIMAVKIEKDTIIGDVLDIAPQAAPLFFAIGMHCLGCPSSRGETVEEACMVHGIECEPFLAQLNHFLEAYEANQ